MWRVALLLAACSQPEYVSGHLHCAPAGRACPDNFYCAADGLCWTAGSGPEMGGLPDMATGDDLAVADLSGADLAGLDFAQPPDLTPPVDLAGIDAAPPSLCPGTYKICDGFEAATINSRWSADTHRGTITLDNIHVYRGSQALHLHTNADANSGDDPFANLVNTNVFPLSGTAFARAWVFFPSTYSTTEFNQVINFSDINGSGVAFATQSNINPVINDYTSMPTYQQSTMTLPANKWVCLSLAISQTGTMGAVTLSVGDAAIADVSYTNITTPSMTHLYIGLDWVGNPSSFQATDLWIDEVIVNDSPVSCSQ